MSLSDFNSDLHQRSGEFEDLAYSPSGGRFKQILVGCILALALLAYAVHGLIVAESYLAGGRGSGGGVVIHGEAARWLSAFYLGIALFMHFHWFWGLVPMWRTSQTGKTIGCLIAIAGLARTMWLLFFY